MFRYNSYEQISERFGVLFKSLLGFCLRCFGAFAPGAVGRRIDPSWGGPIELFLVPASVPRLVQQKKAVVCVILSVGWCI